MFQHLEIDLVHVQRALFVNSFVPCCCTGERFSVARQQHRTAHTIDNWFGFSAAPILQLISFCFILFYFVSSSTIYSSTANFRINSNVIYFVCNCINFNEAPRAYIKCSMLEEEKRKQIKRMRHVREITIIYIPLLSVQRERESVCCVCFILSPHRYLKTFNVLIGFIWFSLQIHFAFDVIQTVLTFLMEKLSHTHTKLRTENYYQTV